MYHREMVSKIQEDFDRIASLSGGRWDHNNHYHSFLLKHIPLHCESALEIGCGTEHFRSECIHCPECMIVHVITKEGIKIHSGKKEYIREETFLCMTTLPVGMADADTIRRIVHAKWGIENNAIKDLKDNWFMTHNLFYAYVFRHLKSYRLYHPTMKRVAEDFMSSYLHWKWRMSWVHLDGT